MVLFRPYNFHYFLGFGSFCFFVLQHYGKEIIAKELERGEDHQDVQRLYIAVYKSFIEVMICNVCEAL